jgi:hypothetical protein
LRLLLILPFLLAAAAPGETHTLTLTPPAGDLNTLFSFKGRGWQPRRRVDATYFVSVSASRGPDRWLTFKPRSNGGFVFKLTRPIGLVDAGVTSRMCFRQRDTRPSVRRVFRVCEDFYIAPPAAQFMPSTGKRGGLFLLVVSGFLAGRELRATLTLPNATIRSFPLTARKSDGFVAGGPFGPILVPRGGAVVRFAPKETDPVGAYTVLVSDPKAGSRARAVVVLVE